MQLRRYLKFVAGTFLTIPLMNWGVRFVAGPLLRLLPPEKRPIIPVRGCVTIPFEFQGDNYRVQWISAGRDGIMSHMYWRGISSIEKDTLNVFLKLASLSKTFLDVGANTGMFTLFGKTVNPNLRVVAIEPVPMICDALQSNIAVNRFEDTSVLCAALSDKTCLLEFYINATPFSIPTSASIQKGFKDKISQVMHVHALSLDDLNSKLLDGQCDLAKIDVEGAEFSVLEGSKKTLSKGQMLIICEILEPAELSRMASFLLPFGYHIFGMKNGELVTVDPDSETESLQDNNYFLVPDAWRERLSECQLLP